MQDKSTLLSSSNRLVDGVKYPKTEGNVHVRSIVVIFFGQYSHLTIFVSPLNRLKLKLADILLCNIIKFTLAFSRSVWKTKSSGFKCNACRGVYNSTEFTRIYRIMKALNLLI